MLQDQVYESKRLKQDRLERLRKERKSLSRTRTLDAKQQKKIKPKENRVRLQQKAYQSKGLRQEKENRLAKESGGFDHLIAQVMRWVEKEYIYSVDTNVLLD